MRIKKSTVDNIEGSLNRTDARRRRATGDSSARKDIEKLTRLMQATNDINANQNKIFDAMMGTDRAMLKRIKALESRAPTAYPMASSFWRQRGDDRAAELRRMLEARI